jgi:hypothetical protein
LMRMIDRYEAGLKGSIGIPKTYRPGARASERVT